MCVFEFLSCEMCVHLRPSATELIGTRSRASLTRPPCTSTRWTSPRTWATMCARAQMSWERPQAKSTCACAAAWPPSGPSWALWLRSSSSSPSSSSTRRRESLTRSPTVRASRRQTMMMMRRTARIAPPPFRQPGQQPC